MAGLLSPPTIPGLDDARHVVLPSGIVSSGLPAVRDICAQVGIGLDRWQLGAARCILTKDAAGLYAADTVLLSIPRQVGKTYLIGALVFADCIINPATTTVWTAHRFKVARETFMALKTLALSTPMVAHVDPDQIYTAAGNESITFRNGSRIVFAARERGAIRGFSNVRRLILDEAQILTDATMSDLAPTQNQAKNPQMILMGTPPKPTDPGATFAGLRAEALAGHSEGLVYIEYSADVGSDLDDRAAWREANPSYPARTPTRAIQRLRKLLSNDEDFAREALGMWSEAKTKFVIDPATWATCADERSVASDLFAIAVDVSPDRSTASVALGGQRADGRWHVELDEHRNGVGWLLDYVAARCERNDIRAVVIDGASPAASIVDALKVRRIKVTTTGPRDMAQACGSFYDGVMEGWLRHTDQPQVNSALGAARKRALGDAWAWNRKNAAADITPLVSCTLALWGAQSSTVSRPLKRHGSGKAVVLQ